MNRISISLKRVFLLLFFLSGAIWCALTPTLPSAQKKRVFYSNSEGKDLKETLKICLKKSKESVLLSVYSLTDPSILSLLNKKAQEGVSIQLYLDRKQIPSLKKKLDPKIKMIQRPQKGLMHQKLFIFDDLLFIGSSNLSTTSLRMHDNLMLGLYSPKWAFALKEALNHQKPFFQEDFEFYLLPDSRALPRLLQLIEEAQRSLDIAQFTFTHPLIIQAVLDAFERGVRVRVLFDFLSTKGASRFAVKRLDEAKVPLYTHLGLQLMHHKMAFIDEKILILGSANWTQSAFERNIEDLLILKDLNKEEKHFLKKNFRHLFWEAHPIKSQPE